VAAHSDTIMWLACLDPKRHRVCPGFCHCSANCIQSWKGFIAAVWKASAFGQVLAGLKLDNDFSFESIADGERVVGLGDFICSSQASII
jgi:hypothetical protein